MSSSFYSFDKRRTNDCVVSVDRVYLGVFSWGGVQGFWFALLRRFVLQFCMLVCRGIAPLSSAIIGRHKLGVLGTVWERNNRVLTFLG